jgi:hypothetical protein
MIATLENINNLLLEGISINGAWNSEQIKTLCKNERIYKGFPPAGWKLRLVGKEISQEQIDKFLSLKNAHIKAKKALFV